MKGNGTSLVFDFDPAFEGQVSVADFIRQNGPNAAYGLLVSCMQIGKFDPFRILAVQVVAQAKEVPWHLHSSVSPAAPFPMRT